MTESPTSPRISSLKQQLDAGNTPALDAFWREIEVEGAPLIEQIEGDDQHVLVTFLWREEEPVKHVIVAGELVGDDVHNNRLQRLGDTNLLYKTYRWRDDLRTCYELGPDDPLTPMTPENWVKRHVDWIADPLNPRRYRVNVKEAEDVESFDKSLSVLELPGAPPQPWMHPSPDGLAGELLFQRILSDTLGSERRIWVYTPPDYDPAGGPYRLLVLTDAIPYTQMMAAPTTLDNLIFAGKLPPTVALFVDNPNRWRDLMPNPDFAAFLAHEVVPWARVRYNATSDPSRTIIGGTSLGGLMAAYAALQHPDVFGCVLSQSGAFSLSPDEREDEENDRIEYEWMARQYIESPTLALRFYLDAGLLEVGAHPPPLPSLLLANLHMSDVLQAKGYAVHYQEFNGGHNYICWQGTLADGLLALT